MRAISPGLASIIAICAAVAACGGDSTGAVGPPKPPSLSGQWQLVGADSFLPPPGDTLRPDSTLLSGGVLLAPRPDSLLLLLAFFTPPGGVSGTDLWIPYSLSGDSVIMHLPDPSWGGRVSGRQLIIHTGSPLSSYMATPPRLLTFER